MIHSLLHRSLRVAVMLLLGWSFTLPALAWGPKGHRIIGDLAEPRLTAATRAAIAEILQGEDLATVSTWADEMRSSRDNPQFWSDWAANWHYVNIEPGATYASSIKNPRGDAVQAIEAFSAILRGTTVPGGPVREGLETYFGDLRANDPDLQRFALRFLVHILGDLQQPLHSGYALDRGGNAVDVSWFGERNNLHAVWDTALVEHQGLSYTEFAARLGARLDRMPTAETVNLEQVPVSGWIAESRERLDGIYAHHANDTELGYDYAFEYVPVVEALLINGGLRTAYLLNQLFDP